MKPLYNILQKVEHIHYCLSTEGLKVFTSVNPFSYTSLYHLM